MKIKITVNSEAQAKFWARVFKLEAEMEEVRQLMEGSNNRRAHATVPVINEFKVDKDLEFGYVLLFNVDVMGPNHVIGQVFAYDAPNKEEVLRVRDELADDVMEQMRKRHDRMVKEGKGEYYDQLTVIAPGQEEEGPPPAQSQRRQSASEPPPDTDL